MKFNGYMRDWKSEHQVHRDCAKRSFDHVIKDAIVSDGVARWKNMTNLVPMDLCEFVLEILPADEAYKFQVDLVKQEAAHDVILEQLVAREKTRVYSAEDLFEMRAAFGPGASVVNVLSGKRIQL